MTKIRFGWRTLACLLCFALLPLAGGCRQVGLAAAALETDAQQYSEGEEAQALLRNEGVDTVFVPGCPFVSLDRLDGDEWVAGETSLVCFWEGFATPVAGGAVLPYDFFAPAPGVWRARLTVAIGCDPAQPLSEPDCVEVGELTSKSFEVSAEPPGPGPDSRERDGCIITGCSAQVCAAEPVFTTCEYLPEYACYQTAVCGAFGDGGACGWEPSVELLECLDATQ